VVILVALFVTLIPTTIGALLSAIGIANIDRLVRFNVLAMSGRAVEAAGDVERSSSTRLAPSRSATAGDRVQASPWRDRAGARGCGAACISMAASALGIADPIMKKLSPARKELLTTAIAPRPSMPAGFSRFLVGKEWDHNFDAAGASV
jgi:hypothetical protein